MALLSAAILVPLGTVSAHPHGSSRAPSAVSVPTYVVIDRHGMVRYVQDGHVADLEARLTAQIERLLHES